MIWYIATVTNGDDTYCFEINQTMDCITVYFVDELQQRWEIASVEELVDVIVTEIDQQCYLNAIRAETDADWLLLDGIHSNRSMTEGEQSAFLQLKGNVVDRITVGLGFVM